MKKAGRPSQVIGRVGTSGSLIRTSGSQKATNGGSSKAAAARRRKRAAK